jgi:hypothetical protein
VVGGGRRCGEAMGAPFRPREVGGAREVALEVEGGRRGRRGGARGRVRKRRPHGDEEEGNT